MMNDDGVPPPMLRRDSAPERGSEKVANEAVDEAGPLLRAIALEICVAMAFTVACTNSIERLCAAHAKPRHLG